MTEATPATPAQTYRRLLGFAKPYRGWLATAALVMAFEALTSYGITRLLKPIVDGLADPKTFQPVVAGRDVCCSSRAACSASRRLHDGALGPRRRARPAPDADAQVFPLAGRAFRRRTRRLDAHAPGRRHRAGRGSRGRCAEGDGQREPDHGGDVGAMLVTSWRVTIALLLLAPFLVWAMNKVGGRYRRINHRILKTPPTCCSPPTRRCTATRK
jgi:subfamily B ATP-binding cassette protein MsbA